METNIIEKYGLLTVIEKVRVPLKNDPAKYLTWAECRCDCGGRTFTKMNRLRTGTTRSCGCLPRKPTTHGFTKQGRHKLYSIWNAMIMRCYNAKQNSFKNYGGRGIKVCDEWRHDPAAFINWALQQGWKDGSGLSIDRRDTNGDYKPSNCRFATDTEQANNKRNNVFLEMNGTRHSVCDWGRLLGIRSSTIMARLKHKWDVERALTEPVSYGKFIKGQNKHR